MTALELPLATLTRIRISNRDDRSAGVYNLSSAPMFAGINEEDIDSE